jgi:hypothetical protein
MPPPCLLSSLLLTIPGNDLIAILIFRLSAIHSIVSTLFFVSKKRKDRKEGVLTLFASLESGEKEKKVKEEKERSSAPSRPLLPIVLRPGKEGTGEIEILSLSVKNEKKCPLGLNRPLAKFSFVAVIPCLIFHLFQCFSLTKVR